MVAHDLSAQEWVQWATGQFAQFGVSTIGTLLALMAFVMLSPEAWKIGGDGELVLRTRHALMPSGTITSNH
jgi:hypothetical protein